MHDKTRKIAIIEGVTAGILFGTSAIFIRFLQGLDTFSIAFWRLIIACVVLAILVFVLRRVFSFNLIKKNFGNLFLLSFFLSLHFIFFISAVKDTTVLNATVLVNTAPIFSMIFSSFFYKAKPSSLAVLGLTLSFIGVCVIAYAETRISDASLDGFSPKLKGDLEATLAALLEASFLTYGRKIRGRMDIISIMLPIYFLTAIIVGVLGLAVANKTLVLPTTMESFLPLVGLGVLPTAAARTLAFSSLSNLKSFETATMALFEPVGATLLGLFLFQEKPAPIFVFGAALILLGILFVAKKES
ncbi:MAG: DMT family transporter [Candidatus Bathyarchaeota archaeon]|jgi:drug/metabolite transporter (DMT)-like permease|nr:DMT family transporter [Candidatus Bathyarchaeota archaeon]